MKYGLIFSVLGILLILFSFYKLSLILLNFILVWYKFFDVMNSLH